MIVDNLKLTWGTVENGRETESNLEFLREPYGTLEDLTGTDTTCVNTRNLGELLLT